MFFVFNTKTATIAEINTKTATGPNSGITWVPIISICDSRLGGAENCNRTKLWYNLGSNYFNL